MSKKPKPVDRRMISVSPELNARMSKAADVNWSAVACRAFEQKLGELAAQKKEKNMEDVIARLKASKNECDSEMFNAGKVEGQEWAKRAASVTELRRLDRLNDRLMNANDGNDWDAFLDHDTESDAFSSADRLAFEIVGEPHDRASSKEFWNVATGEDQYKGRPADGEFLWGFVTGALEIWDAVQHKL
ncbi:MAG TPA: hypothetical protein VGH74_17110 [Planctomycetaceae bacterium]|jgi:hypothetical protein